MPIIVAACLLFGLLLAKLFKVFILVPASMLVLGADLLIPHGAAAFPGRGLEVLMLITSLQIGYVASAMSPLFVSALKARNMPVSIFLGAPFARVLRRDGRILGSTPKAVASNSKGKDPIKPAA